ncbi:MAG: hypothetical protein GWP17_02525 [Aquificales bacterium]|nr:hypothetical protein [Aquificales bacterium]
MWAAIYKHVLYFHTYNYTLGHYLPIDGRFPTNMFLAKRPLSINDLGTRII